MTLTGAVNSKCWLISHCAGVVAGDDLRENTHKWQLAEPDRVGSVASFAQVAIFVRACDFTSDAHTVRIVLSTSNVVVVTWHQQRRSRDLSSPSAVRSGQMIQMRERVSEKTWSVCRVSC